MKRQAKRPKPEKCEGYCGATDNLKLRKKAGNLWLCPDCRLLASDMGY